MPLSDDAWSALAQGLRRAAARAAPGWTDANAHDPGVTVLALLAYALDELSVRNERVSDAARAIAARVAERAATIAGDGGTAASTRRVDGALVRPRFFSGRLLSADDLVAEQDYVRERIDRRNRMLHGAGVVDGLAVSVDDDGAGPPHVVVAPGLAFDRLGREIFVGCPQRVALPEPAAALVVAVAYRERAALSTTRCRSRACAACAAAGRSTDAFARRAFGVSGRPLAARGRARRRILRTSAGAGASGAGIVASA